jgi:hypothetical protein
MPDSEVMTLTDPDAFYANMRRERVEGVVTGRGEYRTELTRIDLHRLWMQRGDESLPRVLDVSPSGERPAIVFGTNQNQLAMHFDGRELPQHEIIITGSGVPIHFRSSGACHWGAISLSLQDLAAAQAITGREFLSSSDRLRPSLPGCRTCMERPPTSRGPPLTSWYTPR